MDIREKLQEQISKNDINVHRTLGESELEQLKPVLMEIISGKARGETGLCLPIFSNPVWT